jgi:serine/threonine protein phosphatase PrpC
MAPEVPRTKPKLRFNGTMLTNIGAVRAVNEDYVAYVAAPTRDAGGSRGSLALVADGMGGHAAGEVASKLAADTVLRVYFERDGAAPDLFAAAFAAANREIFELAEREPAYRGMGTTCTALALRDDAAWLAHVGDSRAYLLRNGKLTQLTEDQTLVAKLVAEGALSKEEAANSPIQNVVLQALGTLPEVQPAISRQGLPLGAGDILILCSDGLTGMVPDATLAEIAGRLPPPEACDALVKAALAAGGLDNISIGVFCAVTAADEASSAPQPTTRRMKIPERPSEHDA